VVLARQLSRPGESCAIHTLESFPCEAVDMVTLVLVGNGQTRAQGGRVLTPRGYLSAAGSGQSG
jgi:precorrin-3B methylase